MTETSRGGPPIKRAIRRLFVCCDGTWNAPTDLHDGVPVPTNVVRFYNALVEGFPKKDPGAVAKGSEDLEAPVEQLRYYHPGVGTEELSYIDRIIAGMTGAGLTRNVKSAYAWLTTTYVPGDEIFLVGFSRGAFTARSLSGLIASQGIHLAPPNAKGEREVDWDLVDRAFDACSDLKKRDRTDTRFAYADIEFLGVWDTVGALGIPPDIPFLPPRLAFTQPRFHDTELSPNVRHAYHALALDEMRRTFSPTLWTASSPFNREILQMWFPGMHADVGGGYRETGLADISLEWMIERARLRGATFHRHMLEQIEGNARGVMHDSRLGLFSSAHAQPRRIPDLDPLAPPGPFGQQIHVSAFERQGRPPIFQAPYRELVKLDVGKPHTFTVVAREKWNWTGIYVEPGQEYEISARGEWMHKYEKSGPEGRTMLGRLMLRRFLGAPWMALAGAIADFENPDQQGRIKDLPSFNVSKGLTLSLTTSGIGRRAGCLYFFANVRENQFKKNRGALRVTIKRLS